jgi:hypothetical protein
MAGLIFTERLIDWWVPPLELAWFFEDLMPFHPAEDVEEMMPLVDSVYDHLFDHLCGPFFARLPDTLPRYLERFGSDPSFGTWAVRAEDAANLHAESLQFRKSHGDHVEQLLRIVRGGTGDEACERLVMEVAEPGALASMTLLWTGAVRWVQVDPETGVEQRVEIAQTVLLPRTEPDEGLVDLSRYRARLPWYERHDWIDSISGAYVDVARALVTLSRPEDPCSVRIVDGAHSLTWHRWVGGRIAEARAVPLVSVSPAVREAFTRMGEMAEIVAGGVPREGGGAWGYAHTYAPIVG